MALLFIRRNRKTGETETQSPEKSWSSFKNEWLG